MKKQWSVCLLGVLLALGSAQAVAQSPSPNAANLNFSYLYFQVPGNSGLSIEVINDLQTIVGFQIVASTNLPSGLAYFPIGNHLVSLTDPDSLLGITEPYGENNLGTIVGTYFSSTADTYEGFFLQNGKYTAYTVPGYNNTIVTSVNDAGDFTGYLQNESDNYVDVGYVVRRGHFSLISIPAATGGILPYVINDLGQVGGTYTDAAGVTHGFLLQPNGQVTPVNVPGAGTASGQGTNLLGVNNFGATSGHFFDSAGNEHGFYISPSGKFTRIDVPGALETAGGGLNDFGVVVGHWVNSGGTEEGYIAVPFSNR